MPSPSITKSLPSLNSSKRCAKSVGVMNVRSLPLGHQLSRPLISPVQVAVPSPAGRKIRAAKTPFHQLSQAARWELEQSPTRNQGTKTRWRRPRYGECGADASNSSAGSKTPPNQRTAFVLPPCALDSLAPLLHCHLPRFRCLRHMNDEEKYLKICVRLLFGRKIIAET